MRYASDRVDIVDGRLRIVDYKTGSSHVEARTFEDIFNGFYMSTYFIQLMLYAHLLEDLVKKEGMDVPHENIAMVIYDLNEMPEGEVVPTINKATVSGHRDRLVEGFLERMERIISDIFSPEVPMLPTPDPDNCTYCKFHALCGRTPRG